MLHAVDRRRLLLSVEPEQLKIRTRCACHLSSQDMSNQRPSFRPSVPFRTILKTATTLLLDPLPISKQGSLAHTMLLVSTGIVTTQNLTTMLQAIILSKSTSNHGLDLSLHPLQHIRQIRLAHLQYRPAIVSPRPTGHLQFPLTSATTQSRRSLLMFHHSQ